MGEGFGCDAFAEFLGEGFVVDFNVVIGENEGKELVWRARGE